MGLKVKRLCDLLILVGPSGCGKSTLIRRLQADFPDVFGFSISHTTRAPRRGEQHRVQYYFVSPDEFKRLVDEGAMVEYTCLSKDRASRNGRSRSPDTQVGNYYGTSKRALNYVIQHDKVVLMDTDIRGAVNFRRHAVGLPPIDLSSSLDVPLDGASDKKTSRAAEAVVKTGAVTQAGAVASTPPAAHPTSTAMLRPVIPAAATISGGSKDGIAEDAVAAVEPSEITQKTKCLRCMVIFITPPDMQTLEARLRARQSETAASLALRLAISRRCIEWYNEHPSFFDFCLVNDSLDKCYAELRAIVLNNVVQLSSSL